MTAYFFDQKQIDSFLYKKKLSGLGGLTPMEVIDDKDGLIALKKIIHSFYYALSATVGLVTEGTGANPTVATTLYQQGTAEISDTGILAALGTFDQTLDVGLGIENNDQFLLADSRANVVQVFVGGEAAIEAGAAAATGGGSLALSAARRSVQAGRLARVLGRGADAASDSNRIIDAYLDGSRYDVATRNTTTETGQRAADNAAPNPRADGVSSVEGGLPLSRPTNDTPGGIILGELDAVNRPTGVTATITEDMLRTGTRANQSIRPPGFGGQETGHARGHLLANLLGGSGDDARNLATLFQRNANHPNMSSFERQIAGLVESGEVVRFRAIPIYNGNNPVPVGITITARGSRGSNLDVSIPNVNGRP